MAQPLPNPNIALELLEPSGSPWCLAGGRLRALEMDRWSGVFYADRPEMWQGARDAHKNLLCAPLSDVFEPVTSNHKRRYSGVVERRPDYCNWGKAWQSLSYF